PKEPEGTILQPRPSPHPGSNNETIPRPLQPVAPKEPEGTILQPRPSSHPRDSQNLPASPINPAPGNTNVFKRNLWIGLAVILAFFGGMYIYYLQTSQDSENQSILSNPTQK
ncbi:serine/threonine protein kinase, partial [Nodularia spumigena CS-587/03]|nr:serine/threonine protein kinase [Nodularia spumigena CS-587/03]